MVQKSDLSRRAFIELISIKAGVASFALTIPGVFGKAEAAGTEPWQPNIWFRITSSGQYIFTLDKSEMGQGVVTTLPTMFGEEFDLHPSRFEIEHAGANRAFDNPGMGLQITGGSTSVKTTFLPLREAGATARAMLMKGVAAKWQVKPEYLDTNDGVIVDRRGGRKMTYAEASAFAESVDGDIPLKAESSFKWIGKSIDRNDAKIKSTGKAVFGIDIEVPDMLHAYVVRPKQLSARLVSYDDSKLRDKPGIVRVVPISTGVAIVATDYYLAKSSAEMLEINWDGGLLSELNSVALEKRYRELSQKPGESMLEEGDFDATVKGKKTIKATYSAPFMAHATMEPQNCTAHVTNDKCQVWAPTQSPGLALQRIAEITGFDSENIQISPTYLGGGFGRRLYQDFIVEAVEISMKIKKPVKVLWTREDDTQHDFYRPYSAHHLEAVVDGGKVGAWLHRVVSQSLLADFVPRAMPAILPDWVPSWLKGGAKSIVGSVTGWMDGDPIAVEGAIDNPYGIKNLKVEFVKDNAPVPVGFWRSVGHSYNGFVVESFIDELAEAAKIDPAQFRLNQLNPKGRYHGVLTKLMEISDWKTPPKNTFQGIALHRSFDSYVAQVVRLKKKNDQLVMDKVFCVLDCGRVINPDIVRAQIEGGIVFGLSQALHGEITFRKGAVEQSNFHDFEVLRMSECPNIEVHIVPSNLEPTGVGEPGVPPAPAALANALFQATKVRQRSMPFSLSTS